MPGFSQKWVDSFRSSQHPPIYEELPDFRALVAKAHKSGKHIGCAVRGHAGIAAWFSPMELIRLRDLGFRVVDASGCEVLAETETQLLVASVKPLCCLQQVCPGLFREMKGPPK